MAQQTETLWRPTGPEELELVPASGSRAWPPRLPDQPIFYPVLQAGGGQVEALPEVTVGRTPQGRFLFEMSVELYEEYGFQRIRPIGKHRWIVRRNLQSIGSQYLTQA